MCVLMIHRYGLFAHVAATYNFYFYLDKTNMVNFNSKSWFNLVEKVCEVKGMVFKISFIGGFLLFKKLTSQKSAFND